MHSSQVITEGFVLSWSAKWLDKKKTVTKALPDYPGYHDNTEDDSLLVAEMWELLDEADAVIGYNVKEFDLKVLNSRFMKYGMQPPSNYHVIDLFKVVKGTTRNFSNRLDDVAKSWGIGMKLPHEGFELWDKCVRGDMKAWDKMKKYNAQDVAVTETSPTASMTLLRAGELA